MKLKKILINNFRSIKECSIQINKILGLVGENNSGKSAVLRALNAFFNYSQEEEAFLKGYHSYSSSSSSRIELTFSDIPAKDFYLDKVANGELILRLTYSHRTQRVTYQYKKNGYQEMHANFIDKVKEDINYIFIPPNRDHSQFKISENTLLKQVIEEYLRQKTANRDLLTPKVRGVTNYLERIVLSKIEKELDKYYSLSHNFKFKIGYDHLVNYSLLINNIFLEVSDHGKNFSIRDCGSGIQSMAIIALYRYLANLKYNNFLLGIEEPETNIHPQAQRELIKTIKEIHGESKEIQVVFTTHSAVIADQLEHSEIVLFRKVADEIRGIKTTNYQIPQDFWTRHDLEDFKYYQFYKYRNSEFFFAKFIIIVESKNEAEVVRLLLEQCGIDIDLYGVSILNLEGVKNLKYPFYLLSYLKIPYFLILDKDYFIPYNNDNLSLSRYESGFPKYRYQYKSETLVEKLIPKQRDRDNLLELFRTNHSKALDFLEKFNMICFNYSLEIDLIASNRAAAEFYRVLNVPPANQNKKHLLVERYKQIKKPENLLAVLRQTPHKNLPNSYKRIKKIIPKLIKQLANTET